MTSAETVLPDLNLQPGELYLARGPAILRTILGSCVGVAFWCRRLQAGALCHGVLPLCPGQCAPGDKHRYVDESIRYLAGEFDKLGVRRQEIVVKVFGGADVLGVSRSRSERPTVGAQNCTAALETLASEGFMVSASDMGGRRGRRIHFHTGTGEVLLHRLAAGKDSHS
ncbi:MAG TPA: chemotaxis protein CheD [Candidatus Sulfopaludibacter sp.]|jgi:chemotaxis protein CheD|nr:chemotaxis protein CheD [Candidatus Sulfopaludibacter sp.]